MAWGATGGAPRQPCRVRATVLKDDERHEPVGNQLVIRAFTDEQIGHSSLVDGCFSSCSATIASCASSVTTAPTVSRRSSTGMRSSRSAGASTRGLIPLGRHGNWPSSGPRMNARRSRPAAARRNHRGFRRAISTGAGRTCPSLSSKPAAVDQAQANVFISSETLTSPERHRLRISGRQEKWHASHR